MASPTAEDIDVSKAFFGSSHMRAVLYAIADIEEEQFSAPQIAAVTGLGASSVHALMTRLLRIRMIEKSGYVPGERTLLYSCAAPELLATLVRHMDRLLRSD